MSKPKSDYNRNTYYKSEKWLNPPDSPSTGSIVCYDGMVDYSDGPDRYTFIELADCHQKVRLHKSHTDSTENFVDKLRAMRNEIDNFIQHFEKIQK